MPEKLNSKLTTDLTDVLWDRLEKRVSYISGCLHQAMVALNIMTIRNIARILEGDVEHTFIPPWVRHHVNADETRR